MMRLKDMPKTELPRERLLNYGVENLSNSDLLCIILRSGVKDFSVKDIANNILNQVGNINNLADIGVRELSNIKGVGNVKAVTILAAIELGKRITSEEIIIKMKLNTGEKVHDAFKKLFKKEKQEKFLAIYLDAKKNLLSYKILFIGTIDYSICHPREVFNEAIKVGASSIIVMHNHPSGNLEPSINDKKITNQLIESGKMLNIPLIDHIITNGEEYYSFYDEYIKNPKK